MIEIMLTLSAFVGGYVIEKYRERRAWNDLVNRTILPGEEP